MAEISNDEGGRSDDRVVAQSHDGRRVVCAYLPFGGALGRRRADTTATPARPRAQLGHDRPADLAEGDVAGAAAQHDRVAVGEERAAELDERALAARLRA